MKQFLQNGRSEISSRTILACKISIITLFLLLVTLVAAIAQVTATGCKISNNCFDITYTSFTRNANNTVTLSFAVQTNCNNALSNIAFELPAGAKATNLKNSNTKFSYTHENPTNNPFYSVKFEANHAEGFKNGAVDNFSYTLTAAEFAKLSTISVSAKAGTSVGTFKFDATVISVNGPSLVEANTIVTYTIPLKQPNAIYNWTVPEGWGIVTGQGTDKITVKTGSTSGTMKVRKGSSCSDGSMQVEAYTLNSTLPVSLTSFKATSSTNGIELTWTTASEKDNKEFILERSKDAVTFEAIQSVVGNGTSSIMQSYSAQDRSPVEGTFYYRLKQVDFDGAFEYSKIISVKVNTTSVPTIASGSVYPNPFQREINFTVSKSEAGSFSVSLYDLSGKMILTKTFAGLAGSTQHQLSGLDQLTQGFYLIKISQGKTTYTQKLLKSN